MGKPRAPAPPDYAAAAREQGTANVNSALATNFMNQANQVGPNGSLTYTYDSQNGYRLPDGTVIPMATATTTLSPEQQRLYDQNAQMSGQMNDLALQGLGYVGQQVNQPIDQNSLPSLTGGLARTNFRDSTGGGDYTADRDRITAAMMERMQPSIDREREALRTRLANQGITQGSDPYNTEQTTFQRGVNDQRIAALLAGDQTQQMYWDQDQRELENFNRAQEGNFSQGLASGQFANQARQQAIQEQDYFRNQPLNMLNALRSGNQVNMPSFGNVTAGSNIQPAPVYAAANDSYNAAMQRYQAQLASRNALLGGLGSLGSAAIGMI